VAGQKLRFWVERVREWVYYSFIYYLVTIFIATGSVRYLLPDRQDHEFRRISCLFRECPEKGHYTPVSMAIAGLCQPKNLELYKRSNDQSSLLLKGELWSNSIGMRNRRAHLTR
jgi:hypothetical protein